MVYAIKIIPILKFQFFDISMQNINFYMKQQEFDKQLIKAIPTGELQESIKNFERISTMDHKAAHIQQTLQQYSQNHLVLYDAIQKQSTQKYCFMKDNRLNDGYYDQIKANFIKVDFLTGKVLEQNSNPNLNIQAGLNQNHGKLLNRLKDSLFAYIQKYYSGPCGATFHITVSQQKITQIKVQFTSKNISLYNLYTGEWLSKWTFFSNKKYQSTIEIKNHFFEGGNILLERKRKFQGTIEKDLQNNDLEGLISSIVQEIQKCESEFQFQLGRIYEDLSTKGLKHLRKITSYTQSKMNWNVNAVLLSKDLIQQSQNFQQQKN